MCVFIFIFILFFLMPICTFARTICGTVTDELNNPFKDILTECGEFSFAGLDQAESVLKSKIFENQSGQERKISIRIQGSCGGALINFIQAAK